MDQQYAISQQYVPVAAADTQTRADFILKTYLHLFGAILLFTGIEVFLFRTGLAYKIAESLLGVSWLMVLGGFVLVSWMASRVAHRAQSQAAQYLALVGFVAAEAIIFVPLLVVAQYYSTSEDGLGLGSSGSIIANAAIVTLIGFSGLTLVAFGTRKDFSFLRGLICWVGLAALGGIVGSVVFGFPLGTWFSIAMIVLAGASILYDTSNIIQHYPQDRYVGASLELFASVALMFWYVLRLFIASRD